MKSIRLLLLQYPFWFLGLPIFDTLFAIIRRIMNGKPIGQADRGHLHHRLLDLGLSHRMSVIILYVVSGALGLVSIALVDKGLLPSIILLIVLFMFGIGGARNLKEVKMLPEDKRIVRRTPLRTQGWKARSLKPLPGISRMTGQAMNRPAIRAS